MSKFFSSKTAQKGFTLIELLVVIAIIGILSSIVFSGLGSARAKARTANVQANLRSMLTNLLLCRDSGGKISINGTSEAATGATPVAGQGICFGSPDISASVVWPAMPTGWAYVAMTSNQTDDFTFQATGDSKTVSCSVGGGCTTS